MVSDSPQPSTTRADRLFDKRRPLVDFAFDADVAAVFPDMIRRSVPGYETLTPLAGLIAAHHLPAGGRCYDLGCALGAAALAVLRNVGDRPCELVAVDDSQAMLDQARAMFGNDPRLRWRCADVRRAAVEAADVVILNYTLQFLPRADRAPLLGRIRRALSGTGVLILSEKIAATAYVEALHRGFKRANGYSDLAITQKRAALENVMRVDSLETHLERLRAAGFGHVEVWFRCLNWASVLAFPEAPEGGPSTP